MKLRTSWTVACVQMDSGSDWKQNLNSALSLALRALKEHPKLIAFPENFCYRGTSQSLPQIVQESHKETLIQFKKLAKSANTAFLLGSLLEPSSSHKFYNTSYFILPSGRVKKYRKIHLFDSQIKKASVTESKTILRGEQIVSVALERKKVGLTICYDLRFPELFRELTFSGVSLICVPANFTKITGKAHWEVLLRARAIENQVFILAPAQCGKNPDTGLESYGNTMVISPWGEVIARASKRNREQIVLAKLDFKAQQSLRKSLPALRHVALKRD